MRRAINFRRWLYLGHRWLGISMCLLVAMWFFSGVVMMYVGFPQLTRAERLAALPELEPDELRTGPAELLQRLDPAQTIEELRLTTVLGRPAWLMRTGDGTHHGLFADTGGAIGEIGAEDALQASRIYAHATGLSPAQPVHRALLLVDQWSVSSSLHPHRPLHAVALNDPAGTELYVSSVTGEVVRDTSALERGWNWLGANLHWIYPVQLRQHVSVWHWVIVVLSIAGLVSIITGAVVGVMRLRFRNRYRGGSDATPYRGTLKLHHILGLVFLIPLTTFLLSGLLSMNPWGVFDDDIPFSDRLAAYRNTPTVGALAADLDTPTFGALNVGTTHVGAVSAATAHVGVVSAGTAHVGALAAAATVRSHPTGVGFPSPGLELEMPSRRSLSFPPDTRELVWQWMGGSPYAYAVTGDGRRQLLTSSEQGSLEESVLAQLKRGMAGHRTVSIERLTDYDLYYYSHHQRWRPLPVLRVRFDDANATWYHIDLTTGELINQLTETGRAKRWLYNGLHSLDFGFLIDNRPVWDVVVIVLCSAGFLFSSTAVVVSWRRLLRIRKRHRAKKA
ncbi:MAG: PepSY domain-containing protein [Gemmatimonadetes bacterium]|nr:PepSY domain-containing protein [Gemmatimonadota bacterium]